MSPTEKNNQNEETLVVEAQEATGFKGGAGGYCIIEKTKAADVNRRGVAEDFVASLRYFFFEGIQAHNVISLNCKTEPKFDEDKHHPTTDSKNLKPIEEQRHISISLRPEDFSLFLFGSSEQVESITLEIYPVSSDDHRNGICHASGYHPMEYGRFPRSCFFSLQLAEDKFDSIWSTLAEPTGHAIRFGIQHGSFHHGWSLGGGWEQNVVKLLLANEEVTIPDDQSVDLIRLQDDVVPFLLTIQAVKELRVLSTKPELLAALPDSIETGDADEHFDENELSFHASLQDVMIAFWNVHGVRLAEDILFIKYGVYLVAGLLALLAYFSL